MTSPHMMSEVMTLGTHYLSTPTDKDQDQAAPNLVGNRSPGALVSSYGRS